MTYIHVHTIYSAKSERKKDIEKGQRIYWMHDGHQVKVSQRSGSLQKQGSKYC